MLKKRKPTPILEKLCKVVWFVCLHHRSLGKNVTGHWQYEGECT